MKFLEQPESKETETKQESIRVDRLVPMNIQCIHCDEWSKMEGGPTGDGKAKYLCAKCGKITSIDWKFDF